MKSKRSSYRFRCADALIQLKTALYDGEAELIDISIEGCAIQNATCPVEVGEKILIIIPSAEEDAFEMQGEVLREEASGLGICFTLIEEETQLKLRKYFAKRQRQNRRSKA